MLGAKGFLTFWPRYLTYSKKRTLLHLWNAASVFLLFSYILFSNHNFTSFLPHPCSDTRIPLAFDDLFHRCRSFLLSYLNRIRRAGLEPAFCALSSTKNLLYVPQTWNIFLHRFCPLNYRLIFSHIFCGYWCVSNAVPPWLALYHRWRCYFPASAFSLKLRISFRDLGS